VRAANARRAGPGRAQGGVKGPVRHLAAAGPHPAVLLAAAVAVAVVAVRHACKACVDACGLMVRRACGLMPCVVHKPCTRRCTGCTSLVRVCDDGVR
jgi:hypothetical protein